MNFEFTKRQMDYNSPEAPIPLGNNSFPTPIGPKDTLEVVDMVPANSLLTSMDISTSTFLWETFKFTKSMDDSKLAGWNVISPENREQLSNQTLLLQTLGSGIVDRTPDSMGSGHMAKSLPSRSSIPSPSTTSSSKKCHWTDKYEELIDFHKRFGHCVVPNNWKENVKLSQWVKRQRHQYKIRKEGKSSSLTQERIEALEELGFVWSVQEDTWGERFRELEAYKEMYGHTNVPKNCKRHPQLSVWVKYQRRHLRLFVMGQRSSMTSERFVRLTKLGFQWNPRKEKASTKLQF